MGTEVKSAMEDEAKNRITVWDVRCGLLVVELDMLYYFYDSDN